MRWTATYILVVKLENETLYRYETTNHAKYINVADLWDKKMRKDGHRRIGYYGNHNGKDHTYAMTILYSRV